MVNQNYVNGYTDYLDGLSPQSDYQDYLKGYYDQKYNTKVLGI